MYVDDGQAHDDGNIKVDVGGEEYSAEANVDLNDDGIADAVSLHTDTGFTVYADTDHDGVADEYAELDTHGHITTEASFDQHTHQWVHEGSHGTPDHSGQAATGNSTDIRIDSPHGETDAGRATIDTDNDGRADTAVVDDGQGGKVLATDANGDGQADQLTQVSGTGEITVSHHTGAGEWTVTQHGHVDGNGQFQQDSTAPAPVDEASDEVWGGHPSGVDGVARIDAVTGQWISRN